MTDQEKQDLNEKLARWAGWRQLPQGKQGYHCSYIDGKQVRAMNWLAPQYSDKEWYFSSPIPPRFADSLDACFKCLVPKLEFVEVVIFCDGNRGNSKKGIGYCVQLRDEADNIKGHSLGWHETPAVALCLAIEKIIDKEANAS